MKKILTILSCTVILVTSIFLWKKILTPPLKKPSLIVNVVKEFPFEDDNSLEEWDEKVLKGRVIYRIEKENDAESYVRAKSQNAASALFYKIKLDIRKKPLISWKWRVEGFPKKTLPEKLELKEEEDFAARVYVIFPAPFFTKSKAIEYIWSEKMPIGTSGTSAYSKNIKILVLESGPPKEKWLYETRDIYKDYTALFGEKPYLGIGAIAFMTDADSTKTEAIAAYDDIKIGYEQKR